MGNATNTTHYPVGERKEWPLYGRKIRQASNGEWYVDCCFCG